MITQFNYDAALAMSSKILNFLNENTKASKSHITKFLINAKSTLEEIYNEIEKIHLKLIAENSVILVNKIIVDCEHALISINSINLKIEILIMDGIFKIKARSNSIKSLFCEFFNKLQLICEEENNQVIVFFTRIVRDAKIFKNKFSTLILQLLETSTGTFY